MDNVVLQDRLNQDGLFYLEKPQVTFTAHSGARLVWMQGVNSSADAAVLTQSALSPPLSTAY